MGLDWFAELHPLLRWVVAATLQASVLIVLVLAVQLALGKWLTPRTRYALWGVVLVRLLIPVAPQSPLSVFNLFETAAPQPLPVVETEPMMLMPVPAISTVPHTPTAQAPASPPPAEPMFDLVGFALGAWLAGAAAFALWVVASNVTLSRLVRRAERVTDERALSILRDAQQQMHVTRRVPLIATDAVATPALMGVLRPCILMPPHLLRTLPADQLRFVLMHELAHLKRHDIALNWLLIALTALHWFNPLVWFAFARLRADREPVRDEMVLRRSATDATQDYGRTILSVLESLAHKPMSNPALAGICESPSQMKRRIRLIARFGTPRKLLTCVGVTALLLLATIGLTDAAEPPDETDRNDAVVGTIAGSDLQADDMLNVLRPRLAAMRYNATDVDGFLASARNLVHDRARELVLDYLVLHEAEQSLTPAERAGVDDLDAKNAAESTDADQAARFRDALVVSTYMRKHIQPKTEINDAERRAYYDQHPELAEGQTYEQAVPQIDQALFSGKFNEARDAMVDRLMKTGDYTPIDEMTDRAMRTVEQDYGEGVSLSDPRFASAIHQHNVRMIAHAVLFYAVQHEQQAPPNLGATFPFMRPKDTRTGEPLSLTPQQRARLYLSLNDQKNLAIPDEPTDQWMNEHSPYVYLGSSDARLDSVPPELWEKTPIVHEPLDAGEDEAGRVYAVAMLDSRLRLMSRKGLAAAIAASPLNAAAAKLDADDPLAALPTMQQPIDANFEQNRLTNVLDYVRNVSKANIFINWPRLEAAGIAPNTPITLKPKRAPAGEILREVMTLADGEEEPGVHAVAVIDGVVVVSTPQDIAAMTADLPLKAYTDAMPKLREPVPVEFDANKLVTVLKFFENTTGVAMQVNWEAIEAAGVTRDAPISLQLHDVPAALALRLVLRQVGEATGPTAPGMAERDGELHVSTREDVGHDKLAVSIDSRAIPLNNAAVRKLITDLGITFDQRTNGVPIKLLNDAEANLLIKATQQHALLATRIRTPSGDQAVVKINRTIDISSGAMLMGSVPDDQAVMLHVRPTIRDDRRHITAEVGVGDDKNTLTLELPDKSTGLIEVGGDTPDQRVWIVLRPTIVAANDVELVYPAIVAEPIEHPKPRPVLHEVVDPTTIESFGTVTRNGTDTASGKLVLPQWVLTSASILENADDVSFSISDEVFKAEHWFRHGGYDRTVIGNGRDIALVKLERPVRGVPLAKDHITAAQLAQIDIPAEDIRDSPQLAEAVEAAKEQRSESRETMRNLMNIGAATMIYAANHDDRLPPDLGATLAHVDRNAHWTDDDKRHATPQEKAQMYLSAKDQQTTRIPDAPTPQWINEHTSYEYLGGGASWSRIPADQARSTVLIHEKLDAGHEDAKSGKLFALLFADGHAVMAAREQAEQLIEASKQTLTRAADANELLSKPISVAFNATPLEQVIETLRDRTGSPIVVNWEKLEAVGVTKDRPISLSLTNVPASQVVSLMLAQAGKDLGDLDKPTSDVIENVLTISTWRDMQRTTEIRTYDVRDLIMAIPNFTPDGAIEEQGKHPNHAERIDLIMAVITDTIGTPEEWDVYGGSISTVRHLNAQLIVKTSPANHAEIKLLLDNLLQERQLTISFESAVLLISDSKFAEEMGIDLDFAEKSGDIRYSYLDDFESGMILKAAKHHKYSRIITVPRLTVFKGQSGYVTNSRQTSYISGLTRADDGADVELSTADESVTVTVQGKASGDRRSVHATVQLQLHNITLPLKSIPWPEARPDEKLFIEDPELRELVGELTFDVPDRGTVLIDTGKTTRGPMKLVDSDSDATPENTERRVWLLVKPTIIVASKNEQPLPAIVSQPIEYPKPGTEEADAPSP